VSTFVRDNALARRRDDVAIVSPGVDTLRFSPGGRPEPNTILFVGPLSRSYRWKGVDVLLEAFDIVRRAVPEARLVLVGEGDRVAALSRTARWYDGHVELRGRLSEEDLAAAYRAASVVVLPSLTDAESFGMVLAEANACGRPVVASNIGGVPTFVKDGDNGLLARAGNAYDLAAQLMRLIKDPGLADAMGRRGRARVLRSHAWPDIAAATERVLLAAVSDTAGSRQPVDDATGASLS
jgi:glycosyltransferase involved in cell wall biosynthesis